jgi:hypothetical protein
MTASVKPIASFRVQLKKGTLKDEFDGVIEKYLYNPVTEDTVYRFKKELEYLFERFNQVCDFEVTFDYSAGIIVTPKAMEDLELLQSLVGNENTIGLNKVLKGD